jgi:hypothetical protein
VADGTQFQIDIATRAAGVDSAAAAVSDLASKLTAAGAASVAAADAVKAGETAYKQAEASANRAALALEKIGLAADAQRGKLQAAMDAGDAKGADKAAAKLQALVERQGEAAAKAQSATAAMNAEAAALDKLKAAAGGAATGQANISKALDQAKAKAAAASKAQEAAAGSSKANEAAEAFGKLGGPLGAIGQKAFGAADALKKMGGSLGSLGPYAAAAVAIVAIATAAVTATIALVGATIAIASWAVGLADAARSQGLLSAGIAKSVAGGAALDAVIGDLENRIPASRDELTAMAKTLADSGLKGSALATELEKTATAAAKLKFGPDFARQMLSLDSQSARLKRNIAGVFGGLQIEGLLTEIAKLVGLFDSTNASGKAIKVVFESLFQPLIDGVTAFIPKMVSAFIQFEILALKALIQIKPFGSTILFVAKAFGVLAAIVALMTAGFLVAVVAPFVIIAGIATAIIAGIMAIGGALLDAGASAIAFATSIYTGVKGPIDGVLAWLQGLSIVQMGTDLIMGLVEGITAAAGAVLGAVTGVVGGAVDAAKSALGIASPSKVFAQIGGYTAEGMAQGVDAGAGAVQGSLESMVAAPEAGPAGAAAPAAGGGGSSGSIYNLYFTGGDAQSNLSAFRDFLESIGAQAGTAVPNA